MPGFNVEETDQAKLDRSKATSKRAQSNEVSMQGCSELSVQGMSCQVSVVKAQRFKDAMPGFNRLSDQGTPCQLSVVKAQ